MLPTNLDLLVNPTLTGTFNKNQTTGGNLFVTPYVFIKKPHLKVINILLLTLKGPRVYYGKVKKSGVPFPLR